MGQKTSAHERIRSLSPHKKRKSGGGQRKKDLRGAQSHNQGRAGMRLMIGGEEKKNRGSITPFKDGGVSNF